MSKGNNCTFLNDTAKISISCHPTEYLNKHQTDLHQTFSCMYMMNKKHLKKCWAHSPLHALILHCHSPGVATVARRLHIDVHDNDNNSDNA